jgi:response regulator of citrate/malate metabolism
MPENLAEFELALYELRQAHLDVVEARQAKLDELVEVDLTTVERQYLPKRGIAISALAKLAVFVVPDTEKAAAEEAKPAQEAEA